MSSGAASAEESRGWFGAEVVDVTKAEADKLGWDAPHGAKVSRIEPGSPAAKAGLKVGDILLLLDRVAIDNAADFTASLGSRRPGTELRLRVQSGGREIGVAAVLGERQTVVLANDAPILQLDTGGHMGLIKGLAFTPEGRYLISAGADKVIRVWDWRAGTTVRSIRGQAGAGSEGKVDATALSPDGRWLAVGGWHDPTDSNEPCCGDIRLYEFGGGRLVGLLRGHTSVVNRLAFAPDGKRLISGTLDHAAIIWNVERLILSHHLKGHTDVISGVAFSPDGTRAITGSYDKTLKLWSVDGGQLIATLPGHKEKVSALAVSGDGTIASGSGDGEIRYGMAAPDASCVS